jgi:hypothetical protein
MLELILGNERFTAYWMGAYEYEVMQVRPSPVRSSVRALLSTRPMSAWCLGRGAAVPLIRPAWQGHPSPSVVAPAMPSLAWRLFSPAVTPLSLSFALPCPTPLTPSPHPHPKLAHDPGPIPKPNP